MAEAEMAGWIRVNMSFSKLREMVKDRKAWCAAAHGVTKRHDCATEQQQHCKWKARTSESNSIFFLYFFLFKVFIF